MAVTNLPPISADQLNAVFRGYGGSNAQLDAEKRTATIEFSTKEQMQRVIVDAPEIEWPDRSWKEVVITGWSSSSGEPSDLMKMWQRAQWLQRAQDAEERAQRAEHRAQEAEERAQRTEGAEKRAQECAQRAQQRAQDAEDFQSQLARKLRAQTQRAKDAEQRAKDAEQRAKDAEDRAQVLQAERGQALRQGSVRILIAELKGLVATKSTLDAMGEDVSTLDRDISRLRSQLARARSERTFARSNFKREYDHAKVVPITLAAQIIGKIQDFVFQYCYVHGLISGPELQAAKYFAGELQRQVVARPDGGGGGGDLLAEVRHTAALLWTSQLRFEGMGDHANEFCSLLNAAIRDDVEELSAPAVALTLGINALCLQAREGAALAFPPLGEVFRGTGFDDDHRGFFEVGRAYRVPGFLATSFSEAKATEFMRRAQQQGKRGVLWVVRVDPAGEQDPTKRCKHVNFVEHSLVAGEFEYLFTAYSIFTVRGVTWGVGGEPHRIELDAASDNSVEAEGGHGDGSRWATPVGSEALPLAPWY
eukprot:COSAG02_NODE_1172_length_14106_cov_77.834725_2_plen_535_part_00